MQGEPHHWHLNASRTQFNALHSMQCPGSLAGADQMSYSDKTSQTNHKASGTLVYQRVCLKWSVGKPDWVRWIICCLSNGKSLGYKTMWNPSLDNPMSYFWYMPSILPNSHKIPIQPEHSWFYTPTFKDPLATGRSFRNTAPWAMEWGAKGRRWTHGWP